MQRRRNSGAVRRVGVRNSVGPASGLSCPRDASTRSMVIPASHPKPRPGSSQHTQPGWVRCGVGLMAARRWGAGSPWHLWTLTAHASASGICLRVATARSWSITVNGKRVMTCVIPQANRTRGYRTFGSGCSPPNAVVLSTEEARTKSSTTPRAPFTRPSSTAMFFRHMTWQRSTYDG